MLHVYIYKVGISQGYLEFTPAHEKRASSMTNMVELP